MLRIINNSISLKLTNFEWVPNYIYTIVFKCMFYTYLYKNGFLLSSSFLDSFILNLEFFNCIDVSRFLIIAHMLHVLIMYIISILVSV